jgi:hypothetical protein
MPPPCPPVWPVRRRPIRVELPFSRMPTGLIVVPSMVMLASM